MSYLTFKICKLLSLSKGTRKNANLYNTHPKA